MTRTCKIPVTHAAPSFLIGPNDLFEIHANNPPDPPEDDDEVIEPQDYTGEYPLESDDGEDDE